MGFSFSTKQMGLEASEEGLRGRNRSGWCEFEDLAFGSGVVGEWSSSRGHQ